MAQTTHDQRHCVRREIAVSSLHMFCIGGASIFLELCMGGQDETENWAANVTLDKAKKLTRRAVD